MHETTVYYESKLFLNNIFQGDDCNGHGTHCSGTVAGSMYGVAKAANVYGVRVLSCLGSGSWAGVVEGKKVA